MNIKYNKLGPYKTKQMQVKFYPLNILNACDINLFVVDTFLSNRYFYT